MTALRTTFAVAIAATMWVALTVGTMASEELNRAKELYRAASYDEALGVLDSIPAGPGTEAIEVHEYRVLCLVALDKKEEARKAMSALITDNPSYLMSDEASPRVRTMFTEVRRALLPSIAQRAYAEAKAAFDAKDPTAVAQFDRVLSLLRDPDVAGNAGLADMATVAAGFRDLSKALAPAPVAPPSSPPPARAATPPPPAVVGPVVISQPVPIPQIREAREWDGEVEVTINERGRVIAARMTKPIHPVYDQQLVRTAMSWTYKPALRDGEPTLFVKMITIHVDTRPECSPVASSSCRPAAGAR